MISLLRPFVEADRMVGSVIVDNVMLRDEVTEPLYSALATLALTLAQFVEVQSYNMFLYSNNCPKALYAFVPFI